MEGELSLYAFPSLLWSSGRMGELESRYGEEEGVGGWVWEGSKG